MRRFTYSSGQRPLEGYTIKRGVGAGGFGEVYFALSDGGKELALKLLHANIDVEIRGVAHCLNLKHPNLVHVYDLKESGHETWLVMEYVHGETLSDVLSRHPGGLPTNLTHEWFSSLSKAVGHLHDRGVMHRDLKPANIFIESGTLKVGDYGLCKSLGTVDRQTRAVGSVYYMAPEVSTGNYTQSVDVYACGVILHEMITGKLPFDGQSDGEVMMKHLTAAADLTRVPLPLRPILERALDKNPVRRFATIHEMAKQVETCFACMSSNISSPVLLQPPKNDAYSDEMPTRRAISPPPGLVATLPPPDEVTILVPDPQPGPEGVARGSASPHRRGVIPVAGVNSTPLRDRLGSLSQALLTTPLIVALGIVPYVLVSNTFDAGVLAKLMIVTTALSWAIMIGSGSATYRSPDRWVRRLRLGMLGFMVGGLAYWLDGWTLPRWGSTFSAGMESYLFGLVQMPADEFPTAMRYLIYFGGVMAAGRWWRPAARDRQERVRLLPVLAAGFWATLLLFLWPWQRGSAAFGVVPFVLGVIAVQATSPWTPPEQRATGQKQRLRTV